MFDLMALLIFATFLFAGAVKGVTGMGLPTVAMGLLGLVMPPVAAAALLLVPSFVTNVWQLFAGARLLALARRLWPMLLGIIIATIAGASLLTSENGAWTQLALGGTLVIYAGVSLLAWQPSVPARFERWLSPAVGIITGAITGATGVFVIPAVPYLQALGLSKDDLVQALGLSFTVSTIALAFGLARGGALELGTSATSALAVLPALAGMAIGQTIRSRIDPVAFRRWFLVGLFLLGLQFTLRPLV